MKHGSLFSGIGGFDLASRWMGWSNVFTCEIEPFPRQVLKHHFPEAIHYEDIKQTSFAVHRGEIDILTGGFPCQPFSVAGDRLGSADDRFLWPEMYRAIREIQPRWVVAENVRGLLNWSDGMVFEQIATDLEDQGYEVITFVLPAAGVKAPHKRERVWIVANRERSIRSERRSYKDRQETTDGYSGLCDPRHLWCDWKDDLLESAVSRPVHGLSSRLDGISFPRWRWHSVTGFGNAIVPQIAFRIFQTIQYIES